MAQMVNNLPTMQETRVQSLGWVDLLEKGVAIHMEFHGQRSRNLTLGKANLNISCNRGQVDCLYIKSLK